MKSIKVGKSKPFSKPTFLEVSNLFFDKGVRNQVEAKKFFAYYESIGWVIGRRPMRSWRAAVAGWVLRMADFAAPVRPGDMPAVYMSIKNTPAQDEEERLISEGYERLKAEAKKSLRG
jgi:hypothetical protein